GCANRLRLALRHQDRHVLGVRERLLDSASNHPVDRASNGSSSCFRAIAGPHFLAEGRTTRRGGTAAVIAGPNEAGEAYESAQTQHKIPFHNFKAPPLP